MMRQTEKWFTDRFFDLFFPAEGFGGYSCQLPEKLSLNSELTIVVCGAGAGVLEATIARDLCRKASIINIAFIDISDEPLSILHWILQHHKESKNQLRAVFDADSYPRIDLEKIYHASIDGCQINYAFFVENLELNPNPQNQNFIFEDISDKSIRENFNDFIPHILDVICSGHAKQKPEIDMVVMSMVLQHLSFWRSLIVYFNHYLSDEGCFLVNEFGKDDYLLGFDVANALLSTDADTTSELQRLFSGLIDRQFSILSDNNEICATNIDICRHFFEYWGARCDRTTEAFWRSSVSGEFIKALFAMPMFSPFKRYNSLIGIDQKRLSQCISDSSEYEMHFSLHWFLFGKLNDLCARHFDVVVREQLDTDEVCRKLRRYITEVFEKLQANTTIFSLMRNEAIACKIVPELFELLGRFCLFGIGECSVEQLTLFVNGYDTGYVFPLVNSSLCGDVVAQMQLLKEIKKYNVSLAESKIPSSNELFFDVYKDVFTSPFAVILEPNSKRNRFRDDEFHNGFHFVRLEWTSSGVGFSCKTILNPNGLAPDVFKLLANQGECIPDKRCALIPCFRENVGTGSNGVGREFTASLIVGYREDDADSIRNIEEHLLPFFSWLMRVAVEFSGIGVAIDFVRYEHKVQEANTHSAIGSIMSRNGSHNIGSHVLSALSHNVGTMPDDRVLYQYIQHRMDYIASAVTSAPDWSVPTPFVGNLMKVFYSQRHLLDHIAESDGLHAYQYQGKGTQVGDLQHDCVRIITRKIERYKEGEAPKRKEKNEWDRKWLGGECVDIYEFFQKATVNWNLDEVVSIPGGVLGQHAFYNIIENVLRNAAKHSWAGQGEEKREKARNLEIYIDFEKREDIPLMKGWMCFTVGDNMSRLFPEEFWGDFFKTFPSTASAFANPLDGFEVLPEEKSKRALLSHYLEGKDDSALPDSLPHYQLLQKYVMEHWDVLRENKAFLALLQGKDPNPPEAPNRELGHRLPLPLHHRQEIALAKPFIDLETNRLRQAAWGLSEMKISAGYLRRAEVSVIGGLKPDVGKLPLIVPMGIPCRIKKKEGGGGQGESTGDDASIKEDAGKLCYEALCLAYRFWIKLPKDVLIVADDGASPFWKAKLAGWEGLGVEKYADVFGDRPANKKGDIGKMSDYSFVLVDHSGEVHPDDKLKLPFRALRIVDDGQMADGMPFVLRSDLANGTLREFIPCVYRAWLGYWKRRRWKEGAIPETLAIRLKINEESGREHGLISDKDIYRVLFQECLHSVLEPIANGERISDKDPTREERKREALLLVSLYPLNEKDDLFTDLVENFKSGHRFKIQELLGKIAGKVRLFLDLNSTMSKDERDKLRKIFQAGLEDAKDQGRVNYIDVDSLLAFVRQDETGEGFYNLNQELSEMDDNWRFSTVLQLAAEALDSARATSDVFLRKYEERIVTLPVQYKSLGDSGKQLPDFSNFGVHLVGAKYDGNVDISYKRHDNIEPGAFYCEALSGAQDYLNALANLTARDGHWAMRLAENGLLRIAIIDERVRAFIADHGEEIRKTYASMHIAVVDTEKKPIFDSEKPLCPDLMTLPFAVNNADDEDFDLVVIHQGIIDKWWPNTHEQKDVKIILNALRNPQGVSGTIAPSRFVVVTTGRGRPDNIPETEKVLAFSSIESYLFKRYPEKLNLVNSLMSILPGSPERNSEDD